MERFMYKLDGTCPECGSSSMEIYDIYNNKIGYFRLLSLYKSFREIDISTVKNPLHEFRCNRCGNKFIIYWDENGFPYPLNFRSTLVDDIAYKDTDI